MIAKDVLLYVAKDEKDKANMVEALGALHIKSKLEENCFYGVNENTPYRGLTEPHTVQSRYISHRITDMRWEDNRLYGSVITADTIYGKLLEEIFRSKEPIIWKPRKVVISDVEIDPSWYAIQCFTWAIEPAYEMAT